MFKKFTVFSILLALFLIKVDTISAENLVVSSSANLRTSVKREEVGFDMRILKLQLYLMKHNSPMELYASHIIRTADRYDLDWRLVISIAGVESTFGKRMPHNSYNAYGWANGKYKFTSWEESIEIVSKTLREKYIDKGANSIEKIARIYAPPSRTWSGNVRFFMNKIDSSPIEFSY